jgi:hypothetical protein
MGNRLYRLSEAERAFNGKIFQCIDRALGSLGEGVKQSFYHQMKERSNLTVDKFAARPLDMVQNLRDILGVAGSSIVEKMILREINSSFGMHLSSEVTFPEAVSEARKAFLTDTRDKEVH